MFYTLNHDSAGGNNSQWTGHTRGMRDTQNCHIDVTVSLTGMSTTFMSQTSSWGVLAQTCAEDHQVPTAAEGEFIRQLHDVIKLIIPIVIL